MLADADAVRVGHGPIDEQAHHLAPSPRILSRPSLRSAQPSEEDEGRAAAGAERAEFASPASRLTARYSSSQKLAGGARHRLSGNGRERGGGLRVLDPYAVNRRPRASQRALAGVRRGALRRTREPSGWRQASCGSRRLRWGLTSAASVEVRDEVRLEVSERARANANEDGADAESAKAFQCADGQPGDRCHFARPENTIPRHVNPLVHCCALPAAIAP